MSLTDRPEGPFSWAPLADAESAEAAQTALYSARKQGGIAEVAQCVVYRALRPQTDRLKGHVETCSQFMRIRRDRGR